MAETLNYFDNIEVRILPINKTFKGEFRLDPGYYSSSENTIHDIETKPLIEFCEDIFNPAVFKRAFQESNDGCRYLASAEIVSLDPEITFISNEQADNLNIRVKKGWILITGFGTIGSIRIVDEHINNYAVANNVARVIPKKNLGGFLAAYLESPIGNQLLNDYAAGAVVKYIESPQISKIPVPVFDNNIVESINEKYLTAVTYRDQANDLLIEANKLVCEYNNLPPINIAEANFFDKDRIVQSCILKSSSIMHEFRLDAHFYNPLAELIAQNIVTYSKQYFQLNQLANPAYMGSRSSRNYVQKKFGVPFLSGKNIIQIKPTNPKYISRQETADLDDLMVKKGWILITRSGTLARTVLVWHNFENHAASEHLIRVIPNEDIIDAGYLYAFLCSDYGYHQLVKCRHGAVIDEITEDQIGETIIPILNDELQKIIGDKVRLACEKRAEAILLENETQEILKQSLTQ